MPDTGRRAPLAQQNDVNADSKADETRMRRALGLGTGSGQSTPQQRPEQARARHRFVQDGGVPVVMLSQKAEPETAALRERIATLEHQLENERAAHAVSRRQLDAEHQAVTALQTRIAHNDLAHKDALEQERRMREAAQESLQEALAHLPPPSRRGRPPSAPAPTPDHSPDHSAQHEAPEPAPVAAARVQPAAASPEIVAVAAEADPEPSPSLPLPEPLPAAPALEKRGRGRPRSTTPPEPKPVRWWTPSYRAQKT